MRYAIHIATAVVLAAVSSSGNATLITIDPGDYSDGTDLSTAFESVILSTAEGSVVVNDTTVSDPLQLTSNATDPVLAEGGFFANPDGTIWSAGQCCGGNDVLRADFLLPTTEVSTVFVPDDTDTGFLQIYGSNGGLLDETLFRSGDPFTLTLSSPDISYALATYGDTGRIQLLTFNTIAVPEPSTLALLLIGAACGAVVYRRRSAETHHG